MSLRSKGMTNVVFSERDDLVGEVVAFVLELAGSAALTFGVGKVVEQDRESRTTARSTLPAARSNRSKKRELARDDLERHRSPFPPEPMAERRYRLPGKVSTR